MGKNMHYWWIEMVLLSSASVKIRRVTRQEEMALCSVACRNGSLSSHDAEHLSIASRSGSYSSDNAENLNTAENRSTSTPNDADGPKMIELDQASSDSTTGALIVLLGDKEQNVAGKTSADANYEQQDSEPTKNDHRVDYTFPKSRTHKRQFARLTVLIVKKSSSKRWFKCRSQELFFLFFFSFLYFYFYFFCFGLPWNDCKHL